MEIQTELSTERGSAVRESYIKHRVTAQIGDDVEIPNGAQAVTIVDLSPFGDNVQVSWLLPEDHEDTGVTNTATIHAHRTHYADEDPIEIPYFAWATTVYEPPSTSETVVYWLE